VSTRIIKVNLLLQMRRHSTACLQAAFEFCVTWMNRFAGTANNRKH